MIKINSQKINEETNELILKVELPEYLKYGYGNIRLSESKVESILDELGVKRGKWKNPRTLGNRPPKFDRFQTLVFKLPLQKSQPKKITKEVDKKSDHVKLKKTTTTRKKIGG
jgi:hypothetical protein